MLQEMVFGESTIRTSESRRWATRAGDCWRFKSSMDVYIELSGILTDGGWRMMLELYHVQYAHTSCGTSEYRKISDDTRYVPCHILNEQ